MRHTLNVGILISAAFAQWLLLTGPTRLAAQSAEECLAGRAETVRVASVEPDFELVLGDQRRVRIAGIDPVRATPAQPDLPNRARESTNRWLSGVDVQLVPLLNTPDRWGRVLAHVKAPISAEAGAVIISVAYALVDAGWARVNPQLELRSCLNSLLRAEVSARTGKTGLWADPGYAILSASDPKTFQNHWSEWVLASGRIRSVNETRARFYLNFGSARGVDLVVTIPRQSVRVFERSGFALKALAGKDVRVRGLLESRFGPQIEIDIPEAIELESEQPAPARFRSGPRAPP